MTAIVVDTSAILAIFDERHFHALRPLWGADYFTILPYDA